PAPGDPPPGGAHGHARVPALRVPPGAVHRREPPEDRVHQGAAGSRGRLTLGARGPRVVVVGGGVIGVCTAYYLARDGADVLLLDRGRVGAEASWGNAGTVSAGHLPLNKPGRVREGMAR